MGQLLCQRMKFLSVIYSNESYNFLELLSITLKNMISTLDSWDEKFYDQCSTYELPKAIRFIVLHKREFKEIFHLGTSSATPWKQRFNNF